MSLFSRMMNIGKGLIRKASQAADEVIDELETNSGVEKAAAAHLERVRQRARDIDAESKDTESQDVESNDAESKDAESKDAGYGVAKSFNGTIQDDDEADEEVKNHLDRVRKRTL